MSHPSTNSILTHSSTGESCENPNHNSDEELNKWEDSTHETGKSLNPLNLSVNSKDVPAQIVWSRVIIYSIYHLIAVYGIVLVFTSAKWKTSVFAISLHFVSIVGITAGAHRLWSHRSYKAKLPLRIFLAFIFTITFQKDIYGWSRDHRLHHMYSETHADPHNASRGFFFAHIGWLLSRKHPDVSKMLKTIDLTDLMEDPVVRFHRKYFFKLVFLCCFLLPTVLPMYLWSETFINSFCISAVFRHCLSMHQTFLVNSAAHLWGNRPYDISINPRENLFVTLGAIGEGFHNYHHTFPYDYSTSEFGIKYNPTTAFIDLMAFFGLAYDRKKASKSGVQARKLRTGQESLKNLQEKNENLSLKTD